MGITRLHERLLHGSVVATLASAAGAPESGVLAATVSVLGGAVEASTATVAAGLLGSGGGAAIASLGALDAEATGTLAETASLPSGCVAAHPRGRPTTAAVSTKVATRRTPQKGQDVSELRT
jgi:hypothetical protein